MPYVSVVIPAYNCEKTIEMCLEAVKQSVYQDYELIVVDCGSQDTTPSIASRFTDKVITVHKNRGRDGARSAGIKAAKGQILVNIDSDVVIKSDTLAKINNYFSEHQEIDALTGLVSKEHPNLNFFSQYKNLYLHYIFRNLPEKVTFLYGSIYALRSRVRDLCCDTGFELADDTALGQRLVSCGKQIAFLKDLDVVHLKKHDLFSFIKNDFQIPFDWAKIFLKYKGWKQLGKHATGYAHSPKSQLVSVALAPVIVLFSLLSLFGFFPAPLVLFPVLIWFLLNIRFLTYLKKEKSLFFGILSSFVTLLDNIVMATGIFCGLVMFFIACANRKRLNKK